MDRANTGGHTRPRRRRDEVSAGPATPALVEAAASDPADFTHLRRVAPGLPMVAIGAGFTGEVALPYLEAGADDVLASAELWKLPVHLVRHASARAAA